MSISTSIMYKIWKYFELWAKPVRYRHIVFHVHFQFFRPSAGRPVGRWLYQSKRFAYYRFWAKGLVKVPTFFRLAQNAYLQDLNFTASALLSFFKVTLRSAAAADLQSASAKVKKFVKTVYQQFFSLDYISKIRIQNGLVWRIHRWSYSMRQNVKFGLCRCNLW